MQVVAELFGADAVLVVFQFILVEVVDDHRVDWQALEVEAAILEGQGEIGVS